jgi:NAD(P)H-nitrite reductase large subunit
LGSRETYLNPTPRTEVAAAAGLGTRRAITVDRRLRPSVEDIYAIGDYAEVEGRLPAMADTERSGEP